MRGNVLLRRTMFWGWNFLRDRLQNSSHEKGSVTKVIGDRGNRLKLRIFSAPFNGIEGASLQHAVSHALAEGLHDREIGV